MFALPTPGESPVFPLATKPRLALDTTTPTRPSLPIFLPETPVSPVETKVKFPPAAFDAESKHKAHCAACSRTLTSAALLSPCSHLVCSQCLTGACKDSGPSPPLHQHLRAALIGLSRFSQRGWGKAHGLHGVQDAHREFPAY